MVTDWTCDMVSYPMPSVIALTTLSWTPTEARSLNRVIGPPLSVLAVSAVAVSALASSGGAVALASAEYDRDQTLGSWNEATMPVLD